VIDGNVGAIVKLKSETDFVAGSDQFKAEADTWPSSSSPRARRRAERPAELDDLKITLKEKIELGDVVRIEAAPATCSTATCTSRAAAASTPCSSRWPSAPQSWPTTSPCTSPSPGRSTSAATTSPPTSSRTSARRWRRISRNEGKPEAALPKIVEGRLNGFFKDVGLLDQPYAKDDKQSITQLIGSATIVRFAQVEIG
jgi:elongation factor Ts